MAYCIYNVTNRRRGLEMFLTNDKLAEKLRPLTFGEKTYILLIYPHLTIEFGQTVKVRIDSLIFFRQICIYANYENSNV